MGFVKDTLNSFTGRAGRDAATQAADAQFEATQLSIEAQEEAAARAQGFFEPFAGVAGRGVEASNFLADPQAQFDFLQENPLFQMSLDNANQATQQSAASRGRLNAGDTLQQLSNNVLLSASPLIDRQRQDVSNLVNLGTGIAGSQANIETGKAANVGELITSGGAAEAAGIVGAQNSVDQGTQNIIQGAAMLFSDERLKTNLKSVGTVGAHEWFTWDWNELARNACGLTGSGEGVIAQQAMQINPDAVILDASGYYKVNYEAL